MAENRTWAGSRVDQCFDVGGSIHGYRRTVRVDPKQIIADLLQAHGGPCALDKIHLPYPEAGGGPAAKFGLGCQLFLSEADRASVRERALQFLIDYGRLFQDKVDQFLPREQRRTVRLRGDPGERIRADADKFPVQSGYSTSLFGQVDIGLPNDDVEPYQAHMLARGRGLERLSFVSATMPVCNDVGEQNTRTLLAAVLRWCEITRPAHGGAGFTLIFASGMSQNTVYALQLIKRFPGFDVQNSVDFIISAESTHRRIKCVNWLTVLCDDLVAELGGMDLMRGALRPAGVKLHTYPGGVVIQAGEGPRMGDTQRNDNPGEYRVVARYTAPVRFEAYDDGLFRVPAGADRKAETLSWIRRFD
jgi:hypothetical protein